MIYYPLSVLMFAGIRSILIITTPQDQALFHVLLGDGRQWGIGLEYAVQPTPGGLAQALHIDEDFLRGGPSALILGDNIYHGHGLMDLLRSADQRTEGATVFAYRVADPERYGVGSFGADGKAESLEEKPANPRSNYTVTGLYFYDQKVIEYAHSIAPSAGGELEIIDVNRLYMEAGSLDVETMGAGYASFDTGTHASLLEASTFTQIDEDRQGLKICCPEEIAWRLGFIDDRQLARLAEPLRKSGYGEYLLTVIDPETRR